MGGGWQSAYENVYQNAYEGHGHKAEWGPEWATALVSGGAANGTNGTVFPPCGPLAAATPGLDSVLAVSALLFGFECHSAFLPVLAQLRTADALNRNGRAPYDAPKFAYGAMAVVGLLYAWIATFGYLTFGGLVADDVWISYQSDTAPTFSSMLLRFAFLLAILLSVPYTFFPLRRKVTMLLWGKPHLVDLWRHVLLTLLLLGPIVFGATVFTSVLRVFEYVGATSSALLVCILPGAIYLRTVDQTRDVCCGQRWGALGLVGIGAALMLAGLMGEAVRGGQ